ncbi:hypothetical protein JW992_09825 [candidate division KSB1 bacterium]|nr:hypothetical protein [candidate division KSB1 bacterium]
MKKTVVLLLAPALFYLFSHCGKGNPDAYLAQDWPKIELRSGDLELDLFKPNTDKGYYRGTRYDWGNQIAQIRYKGHTFFTQQPPKHDPTHADHGIGILWEFNPSVPLFPSLRHTPDLLIRPGIGRIQIDDDSRLSVAEPANWNVSNGQTWAIVENSLVHGKEGGYFHGKRIRLMPPNTVEIQSIVENIGREILEGELIIDYRFSIDHSPIDSDYLLRLAREIPLPEFDPQEWQVTEGTIKVARPLKKSTSQSALVSDSPSEQVMAIFQLENSRAAMGVQVHCTLPAERLEIEATDRVMGPQSRHRFQIKSGQTLEWRTVLTFYEMI